MPQNEEKQEATGNKPEEEDTEKEAAEAVDEGAPEPEPELPEKVGPEEENTVPRENWLRAMADLDNLRRRGAVQTRTALQNERKNILTRFLEVLDSLQMALSAHEGEHNEWVEGTQGISRQMTKIFKDYGVEPIESKGRPFDPNLHEAVSQLKMPDRPDGTVIEELQRGYRFEDGALLRAARVVVSAKE